MINVPARTILMVPSIVKRFVDKAPETNPDVICLDLEDSVPPDEKIRARSEVRNALEQLAGREVQVWVRLNSQDSGLLDSDLQALAESKLDGLMIAKGESAETVRRVSQSFPNAAIIPLIETAAGVLAALEIASSSHRVGALAFGAEDFCADLGVKRTRDGEEIRWPRAQIAIASAAAGIPAIDTADVEYADMGYFESECVMAKTVGFSGKLCIHPGQVQVARRVFSPSQEELDHARQLITFFEREALNKGRAAVTFEGRMIDTPHYQAARRLLDRSPQSQ